jgi:ATP-dependent RNA helicase DeaD
MSEPNETPSSETTPVEGEPASPKTTFADLGLTPEVLRALGEMGFSEPMAVQAAAVPLVRAGRDLMVQSRTGSGKTAAFGIPIIDKVVDPEEKAVQAIVLLPTRELALQVAAEMARVSAYRGVAIVPIYGGAPMGRQIEQLKAGGQVVCGTPGRVLDHLRRGTLKLDRVRCAVLDECDEMLSMGFQEDIESILEQTPTERQTLLFSATLPESIQRLSRRFLRNPENLKLSADFVGVHEIRHVYYSIPGGHRESELLKILSFENPERAIIFCNTREETGRVAEFLRRNGLEADAISSDLSQSEREEVMTRMRAGKIRFLVATDVAARGIDLENLPAVFNYSFPDSPEVYIHRTGRTGRAGRHGTAISMIGPTEVGPFYYVKLLYKIKPEERSLPSEAEIRSKREGEHVIALRAMFPAEPAGEWKSLARRVSLALDGEKLVAALLQRVLGGGDEARPEPRKEPRREDKREDKREDRRASLPDLRQELRSEPPRPEARPRPELGAPPDAAAERPREPDRDRGRFEGRRERERDRDGRRRERDPDRGARRSDGRPPRFERDREPDRERAAGAPPEAPPPPALREAVPPPAPREAAPTPAPTPPTGAARGAEQEYWSVWTEQAGAEPPQAGGNGETDRRPLVTEPARADAPMGEDEVRLFLNLGRKDGASVDDVAALLTDAGTQVPPASIELMNTHSYVNVPAGDASRVCAALSGQERNGRRLLCEPARPKRR